MLYCKPGSRSPREGLRPPGESTTTVGLVHRQTVDLFLNIYGHTHTSVLLSTLAREASFCSRSQSRQGIITDQSSEHMWHLSTQP